MNVADLQDPTKLNKFLQRFAVAYDAANGTPRQSPTASVLMGGSGTIGLNSDLLMSIQNITLGSSAMQTGLACRTFGADRARAQARDDRPQRRQRRTRPAFAPRRSSSIHALAQTGDTPTAFSASGGELHRRAQRRPDRRPTTRSTSRVLGEGWIAIRTPNGTAYTRDGRMQMMATGELQTCPAIPVLDVGGATDDARSERRARLPSRATA